MNGATVSDDESLKKAVFGASLSLLVWSGLTAVALVGWFVRSEAPWGWKSLLTAGCVVLGVTTSALVWRLPSRAHAVLGVFVMVASLARIGAPSEWTWVSFTLVAATFLLLMPLVHAAIVLRDDAA